MFRAIVFAVLLSLIEGASLKGGDVAIEDYPYHLSLQENGSPYCGASLISENRALTSARCVEGKSPYALSVRGGSSTMGTGGIVIPVESICTHPRYNYFTLDRDVSVLTLRASFPLSPSIQLVGSPTVGLEVPDEDLATLTGWSASRTLQATDLRRVNDTVCKDVYGGYKVTKNMVCFGLTESNDNACKSGYPLVYNGVQYGISSWGTGCDDVNSPMVYTKLAVANILEHIDSC